MKYSLTCPRGCGQFVKKEVLRLGCDVISTQPWGVVAESSDPTMLARLNVWSRVANVVYVVAAEGVCDSLDDYFDLVSTVDWSLYIIPGQPVVVKSHCLGDAFVSERSMQSLGMKSIMKQLTNNGSRRHVDATIDPCEVMVIAQDNHILVQVNSSGNQLWQRGYRDDRGDAPIKENLAACLLLSLGWRWKEALLDPCCGSGTICIEAALLALNIAPGLKRDFAFSTWPCTDTQILEAVKEEAEAACYDVSDKYRIVGSDHDREMLDCAKINAQRAGVAACIEWKEKDLHTYTSREGVICTNPPYGQRLSSDSFHEVADLHTQLMTLLSKEGVRGGFITGWEMFPLSYTDLVADFGGLTKGKQWKCKTLHNGAIPCAFWKAS